MITSNLPQLEAFVEVLAGTGAIVVAIGSFYIKGWIKVAELERKEINRDIKDATDMAATIKTDLAGVKATDHIIFSRIDEIKVGLANCITRELYDKLQNEMSFRFDTMSANLSKQITDGFAQVNAKIDRLSDRGK